MRTKLVTIIFATIISLSFTSSAFAATDDCDQETFGTYWNDANHENLTGNSLNDRLDYIVPLRYAWDNGAKSWDQFKRVAFANDPENIVSVNDRLNSQKLTKNPSEWLPPSSVYLCQYVQKFDHIVNKYKLDIPKWDKKRIKQIRYECKRIAELNDEVAEIVTKDGASTAAMPDYEQFVKDQKDKKYLSSEYKSQYTLDLEAMLGFIFFVLLLAAAIYVNHRIMVKYKSEN